jgi:probable HAF family extracellular repeat protein
MSPYARILSLVIAMAAGMPAASIYSVTQVVSVTYGTCTVKGLNNSGQVVGYTLFPFGGPPRVQAFLYANGVRSGIGSNATAIAINGSGQIVGGSGYIYDLFYPPKAYLYDAGVVTALGFLPGGTYSWAGGINDSGQIVGYSQNASHQEEAFLYSGGAMTGLGFLPGGTKSWAYGINNGGQVAGYSTNASGTQEAFLYRDGIMTGIGTLPGHFDSVATAINDQGQVVGYADDSFGGTEAFSYSGGVMTGLGQFLGDSHSAANAINGQGQIVGYSDSLASGRGVRRAFVYTGGRMWDLGTLAVLPPGQDALNLTEATGINDSGQIIANGASSYLLTPVKGRFVPVTPCRVADTRTGGSALAGGTARSFAIPQSGCGIPATARAYSLNVTAAPQGPLGYLTLWPTGMPQPYVSTLNSWDGSVVANAAIVPAGQDGAISVYVSNPADVILDIDGYFDDDAGDSFYPVQPCRVADTRYQTELSAHEVRNFPVLSSRCGLPPAATAYSMNVTVVPADGPLAYLTTWAAGQPQPYVSTLNSFAGKVVANAAIVPAGTGGATAVYVTNPTQVILDTNGYFAPAGGTGGLTFYPAAPCRVADTRNDDGPFGGPILAAGTTRSFAIPASDCSIPATAAAYSLYITAVPDGPLNYLTAWPAGALQPLASTLNSFDGAVVANAAIVPAGAGGAVNVYVTGRTHVILDINGYFAP